MKNKLTDLNNHLFAQLERLGDESMDEQTLTKEISRAKAITQISATIINNARLVLDATTIAQESIAHIEMPTMLQTQKEQKYKL